MWGSWPPSIHARKLKFGTQVKNQISWQYDVIDDLILQDTSQEPSTSSQVWTRRIGVCTSDYASELEFGTEVNNHISSQSILSRLTLSSKYLVRNHQHPLSMDFMDWSSWQTSNHGRDLKFDPRCQGWHHPSNLHFSLYLSLSKNFQCVM